MRVCMISYSFYESDNRVRRYAESLSQRGDHVDVISLDRGVDGSTGEMNGVNIFRVQKRVVNERGKLAYLERLVKFLLRSAWLVSRMHLRRAYDVVHVHNIPDFEVFSALVPKLRGAKVILDIHDILPEFYADKFEGGRESAAYKLLLRIERMSMSFADHVILSNHLWRERVLGRSVDGDRCSVIMNYPDPAIFRPRPVRKEPGKFVLLYPGTVNRHQGLDIAIRAFHRIRDEVPEAEFRIIGEGPERPALEKLARGLDLGGRVAFRDRIPLDVVADEMAKADLGIVPKRDEGFGGEAFSTKTWEFMSLGVPIVLSRTRIDDYYFNERVVRFFEPGSVESLADAIVEMHGDGRRRAEQAREAGEYVKGRSWALRRGEYFALLDRLCGAGA